jgi:two-component system, OmpR family, KDP operon response regulator KdpE
MTAPGALVLTIEDDLRVRKFLRASVTSHGYRWLEASSGEEGLRAAAQWVPDLLLLDLGLPDIDGVEIVKRLREWSALPIIVVSARTAEKQKVAALDAGADDYLSKPFGVPELLARIRAALRRSTFAREPAKPLFTSGPLHVDLERRKIEVDGVDVQLTAIEYKLLEVLVMNAGRVVTHRQLLERVWGPNSADQTQYLRVYVAHLRRKLEPDPLRPRLFLTEVGVGYRLQLL